MSPVSNTHDPCLMFSVLHIYDSTFFVFQVAIYNFLYYGIELLKLISLNKYYYCFYKYWLCFILLFLLILHFYHILLT